MNHFTTDIVQALVTKQDITEIFRFHLEMAMNRLLTTELTDFLVTKNMIVLALIQAILVTELIHVRFIRNTAI